MERFRTVLLSIVIASALILTGCGDRGGPGRGDFPSVSPPPVDYPPPPGDGSIAQTKLLGQDGAEVGTVTYTQQGWEIKIEVDVQGVSPGPHGIGIHEFPECVEDFRRAGLHLNPDGAAHGCPGMPQLHPGDLGNVVVNDDGTGHLEMKTHLLTVIPGSNSVVGRPFILRERRDDCSSRPSGNAGDYIGCGVAEMTFDSTKEKPMEEEEAAPEDAPEGAESGEEGDAEADGGDGEE